MFTLPNIREKKHIFSLTSWDILHCKTWLFLSSQVLRYLLRLQHPPQNNKGKRNSVCDAKSFKKLNVENFTVKCLSRSVRVTLVDPQSACFSVIWVNRSFNIINFCISFPCPICHSCRQYFTMRVKTKSTSILFIQVKKETTFAYLFNAWWVYCCQPTFVYNLHSFKTICFDVLYSAVWRLAGKPRLKVPTKVQRQIHMCDVKCIWFKRRCTAVPKDLQFYLWRPAVKWLIHDMTFLCIRHFLQQE